MLGGAASKITVEIGGKLGASLTSSLRQAQTQVSTFSRNVSRTMNDAALAGRNAFQGVVRNPMWQAGAVAAAGIGAGLVKATRVAMDFEKQMSSVEAKMGNATAAQMNQLRDMAENLGRTTKFTAGETAGAMDFLAMAGYKTNEILAATPGVLNLATAGNLELAQAADIASNILSGMGMEVDKTGRVIEIMAKTATSGNLNVLMMGESMKALAPVAKQAGASLEEVGGMLAVLGSGGVQAEAAGTAVRNMFLQLAAPSKAATGHLQRLGVKTTDAAGNLRKLPDILMDVESGMKRAGIGSAERLAMMDEIFGKRAIASASILQAAAANGTLAEKIREVTDSRGADVEMARKMQDNLEGAFTRLSSAVDGFFISLMGPKTKGLQSFVDGIANVINSVTGFIKKFPVMGKAIVGVSAAFVGLIAIAPFLASFIAVVKSLGAVLAAAKIGATIAGWAGAAGPALAAIKVGLVALTGPVGIAIAAIVGIGLALKAAYDKIPWFRNAVNAGMAKVRQIFQASLTAIRGAFQGFMNWIGGAWKVLTGILTLNPARIQEGFGQAFGGVKQMASSWLGWMKAILPPGISDAFAGAANMVKGAFENIKQTVLQVAQFIWQNGLKQIVDGVKQYVQGIADVIQGVWNVIVGICTGNSEQAVAGVRQAFSGFQGIFDGFSNIAQGAWNLVSSGAQALGSRIASAVQSIPGRVASAWESLKQGAISAFQQVVDFIKTVPSMVADVGKAIIDTIIEGITSRAGALVDTVKETFSQVRDLMPFSDAKEGPFKYLTSSGKAIMGTLAHGISQASPVMSRALAAAADDTMRTLSGPGMAPAFAGGGLTAAGVPLRSQHVTPQYDRMDVPTPAMVGGGQGVGTMNMHPTINVNVAGTSATAADIADTVLRAFQNLLGDAEAGARAFLND